MREIVPSGDPDVPDPVAIGDGHVRIGQDPEAEPLLLTVSAVLLGRVRRDGDDLSTRSPDLLGHALQTGELRTAVASPEATVEEQDGQRARRDLHGLVAVVEQREPGDGLPDLERTPRALAHRTTVTEPHSDPKVGRSATCHPLWMGSALTSNATVVIATGGTAAWHAGEKRMLAGSELVTAAGVHIDEIVDLEPKPSWDLSSQDMEVIARSVTTAVDDGTRSVVVVHGTDTIEETAWLTELLLGTRRDAVGVVFTGAMRFADHAEPDGPAHLREAVAVAQDVVGQGVQLVFGGRRHAARWVRKADAGALDPFESGDHPVVTPAPPPGSALNHAVELLKVGPVSRPEIPDGVAGLVLEGVGAAHIPTAYHAGIEELVAEGVPVVLTSRCRDVERATREVEKVLWAGDLSPEKAALAMMVGLGGTSSSDELRRWWSQLVGNDHAISRGVS